MFKGLNHLNTGIYMITNLINRKFYIGSCANEKGFVVRWRTKYNSHLENAFKKYGKENFLFEILWRCEPKDCLYFEQLYLDYYEPWEETGKGYNRAKIAGNTKGVKQTKQSNEKRSITLKGRKKPSGFGLKTSKRFKGKKLSKEHCLNISLHHSDISGNKNPMWEKNHKPETIEKIRRKAIGRNIKPIERIDPNTGEIKEYKSLTSVEIDGYCYKNVGRAATKISKEGKPYMHKGFFWNFIKGE